MGIIKASQFEILWTWHNRSERRTVSGWAGEYIGVHKDENEFYSVTHLASGNQIARLHSPRSRNEKAQETAVLIAVANADMPELWQVCSSLIASRVEVWDDHHLIRAIQEKMTYSTAFERIEAQKKEIETEAHQLVNALSILIKGEQ